MGGQFSMGMVPEELESLSRYSILEQCHRKYLKVIRQRQADDPGHFISYSVFRSVFPLEPAVAHKCFLKYFQRSDDGEAEVENREALVAEVWGALVLVSLVDVSVKVHFLFALHDRDKDSRLNKIELTIAMETATGALARLKRNPFPPPARLIAKVDCTSVLSYFLADKKCLKYFQNLEVGAFDAGAIIRRQEAILLELATVDARLAELDSEGRWSGAAQRRYREERGGDVALGLLRPMAVDDDKREVVSDAKNLYALARPQSDMIALPASNDMTVFGGSIEPDGDDDRSNRKGNKSRGASRGASRGKSPEKKGQSASGAQSPSTTSGGGANALSSSQSPTRAITAASDTASPEHHDETTMVVSQGDFTAASGRDERDLEAMARAAQMERRNARSAAKMLAVAKQTKAPEAKAFSQGADHSLEAMYTKHLAKAEAARASREAAKQQGVDLEALASGVEEAAAIGRMKAFWSTLADPRTGMAQVDLDTFEDLWEAGTGELLSDAEATSLLFDVIGADANQLGEHTFSSLVKVYRYRRQALKDAAKAAPPPWEQVLLRAQSRLVHQPAAWVAASSSAHKIAGRRRKHEALYMEDEAAAAAAQQAAAEAAAEKAAADRAVAAKEKRKEKRKHEKHRAHVLSQAEALSDPSLIEALEAEEAAREASVAAAAKAVADAKQAEVEAIEAKRRGMNSWPPSNLTLGPKEATSIGIQPHQEWRSTDPVYYTIDEPALEVAGGWVPKSLQKDAERVGITWPRAPKKADGEEGGDDNDTITTKGSHNKNGKGCGAAAAVAKHEKGRHEDDHEEGNEDEKEEEEDEEAPDFGTVPREAVLNLSMAAGHMLEPKARVTVELLGAAGSGPGLVQLTPSEAVEEAKFAKMLPVEAAVARAAAGKAKAETRGQSVLPDEEPLTTNAARLLKELQEDQALSRANFQNAGKAEDDAAFLANFSGGDNEAAEAGGLDEDGAEKKVECSFFDKFVAKGVTWIDLETRFGGDPDHLPLLRKLTKQIQSFLDALVPDDTTPIAEIARCRLVRCRVNKTDLRAQRRKREIEAHAATMKEAHKQASKQAQAKGENYVKPKKTKPKKKLKNPDGSPMEVLEEDFSFQYIIRICFFSSVDPIGDAEEAYKEGMNAEAQTWQGELAKPYIPKKESQDGYGMNEGTNNKNRALTPDSPANKRMSIAEISAGGSAAAAERAAKLAEAAAAAEIEAEKAEEEAVGKFETPREEDEEEELPLPTLAEAIEVVRLSADLSVGWKELYELGKKYAYLRRRLYGVQVDEIPPEMAHSPLQFAEWTRARRNAADNAAQALEDGTSTMRPIEVTQLLEEHGASVLGNMREQRARLAKVLRDHAARIGYGELSQFGSAVARSIYRRFAVSAERLTLRGAAKALELPRIAHDITLEYGYAAEIAAEAAAAAAAAAEAQVLAEQENRRQLRAQTSGGIGDSPTDDGKRRGGNKKNTKKKGKAGAVKTSNSMSSVDIEQMKKDAVGLTFAEHINMQRALRRPQATCADADAYKEAMLESEVLCDSSTRPLEDGFLNYYAHSPHGELADDALALGVGSLDDLCSAQVSVNVKLNGGALTRYMRHMLSPHPTRDKSLKHVLSYLADLSEFYADGEVERLSDLITALGDGWAEAAEAKVAPRSESMAASYDANSSESAFLHDTASQVAQAQTAAAQGANLHPFPGVEEEGTPDPETNTQGVPHDPTGWYKSIAKFIESLKVVLKEPAIANQLADVLTVVLRTGSSNTSLGGGAAAAAFSGGDFLDRGHPSFLSQIFGAVAAPKAGAAAAAAASNSSKTPNSGKKGAEEEEEEGMTMGLLPQFRSAAKGHFGAHWRSSIPNEWDAPDELIKLKVAAEERFAKVRAKRAAEKAREKGGGLPGTSEKAPSRVETAANNQRTGQTNDVKSMESEKSESKDDDEEEEKTSVRSGSNTLLEDEFSLEDNSSIGSMSFTDDGINADQMKGQGEPDLTKGVWGLEWMHGGHFEGWNGDKDAHARNHATAEVHNEFLNNASIAATHATFATNLTSEMSASQAPPSMAQYGAGGEKGAKTGGGRDGKGAGAAFARQKENDYASTVNSNVSDKTGGSASNVQEGGFKNNDEDDDDDEDDYCDLEVGSVSQLFELKAEGARVKTLLKGKISHNERKIFEKHYKEVTQQAARLERTLKHRRWMALAHGLRAYDGIARICKGTSCVGMGNAQMSLRLSLDGFDFFGDCLPAADESLPDPATMHQEGQGSGTDDDSSNDPLGLKPGNDIRDDSSNATPAEVRAAMKAKDNAQPDVEPVMSDILRIPKPSRAEEIARLVREAQARQRTTCAEILDIRKKRWEATESGVAAKAENLKKEAEAAKAREGVRYLEGVRALKKARIMRQPGYLQLANDPGPEEVCDQALGAWRDLREAVGLRNTMACEEWNAYELAQKAPRRPAKKGVPPPPKPVLPLVPRPLAVSDTPSGDYEFLEVAVCESNLAVILAEFGDGRLDWAHESLFLAERAASVIDQIVWRYEKEARRLAAKMLSSGKAVLPELPEEQQARLETEERGDQSTSGSGGGGAMVEASVESGAHVEDQEGNNSKSGQGAEEQSDHEHDHDEDEDDDEKEDEAAKALLQRREALYVEQKVETCLDLNVRVAQIVARHNKLRVLRREARPSDATSTGGSHEESSSGAMDGGFLSPGQEGSITSAFTEGTARFDRVNSNTNPKTGNDAAATRPPTADGKGETTNDEGAEDAEDEEDVGTAMEALAKAERAEAAEAMVLACFEIFESAPADAVAKAQSENPKLTPYIGLERLDTYPPPEFEAIFAARRQAELDAIAFAKRARKLEKQARKEAKLKKIAAKKARQDLKDDPFNIDLIEAAGFVERAKQLRAREAKRARMLEQWHERKALEDQKKAARLLKQMNQERGAADAAAEAAALRHMPRNISSASGKRPVS